MSEDRFIARALHALAHEGAWRCPQEGQQQAQDAHHKHEGHEAAEYGEQDVAALIGEAAARLEQDEGGHEERADRVQQRPVHRRQQPARRRLPRALQGKAGNRMSVALMTYFCTLFERNSDPNAVCA
jgi:hypothetical protein